MSDANKEPWCVGLPINGVLLIRDKEMRPMFDLSLCKGLADARILSDEEIAACADLIAKASQTAAERGRLAAENATLKQEVARLQSRIEDPNEEHQRFIGLQADNALFRQALQDIANGEAMYRAGGLKGIARAALAAAKEEPNA